MTPLERAARALHERRSMWPWDDAGPEQRAVSLGDARAVLMAVREPRNDAVDAGYIAANEAAFDNTEWASSDMVREGFTAMIDAILNEGDSQ